MPPLVQEELGTGAFGSVFRATWRPQGRPEGVEPMDVAVKLVNRSFVSGRDVELFEAEVALLSRLSHPNVVAFIGASTQPPYIYIVQQLVPGGTLYERLHGPDGPDGQPSERPLGIPGELLMVAEDVASALAYLHPTVVHRDLKSHNILLDAEGRPKVCDFGIAKFKRDTFLSTKNIQAGTPSYMAPELFSGGAVGERCDVFSYAVLLWECATGRVPWGDATPMQVIFSVGVERSRLPLDGIPEGVAALIGDCWAHDPADRPGFEEVLERVRALRRELGVGE